MNTFETKNRLFIVGIQQGMEGPIREQFGSESFFLSAGFQPKQAQMNLLLAQVHLLVKQEKMQEIFILEDECFPELKSTVNREQASYHLRDLLDEDPFIQSLVCANKLVIRTLLHLPAEQGSDLSTFTLDVGKIKITQRDERRS